MVERENEIRRLELQDQIKAVEREQHESEGGKDGEASSWFSCGRKPLRWSVEG